MEKLRPSCCLKSLDFLQFIKKKFYVTDLGNLNKAAHPACKVLGHQMNKTLSISLKKDEIGAGSLPIVIEGVDMPRTSYARDVDCKVKSHF